MSSLGSESEQFGLGGKIQIICHCENSREGSHKLFGLPAFPVLDA